MDNTRLPKQPSTTNLEEEEVVDAPGNDGNASMPKHVKRSNPRRKMMMMMMMITKITDFMKICVVGVELFHVDGQASMAKLMVAVHNFASTPNSNKIGYDECDAM